MKEGDEVTFWITGCIGLYRGRVMTLSGHMNRPEIRVLDRLGPAEAWMPVRDEDQWTLKDGDYTLSSV